jgi:hypothetical protein
MLDDVLFGRKIDVSYTRAGSCRLSSSYRDSRAMMLNQAETSGKQRSLFASTINHHPHSHLTVWGRRK